ncbi:MAG: glycerate kinase type-2 family protein [Anaerolineae bacterium]
MALTIHLFKPNIRTVMRVGPIMPEKVEAVQRILNSESLTSHGNIAGRQAMVSILEAGLRAADPYNNTRELLQREGNRLILGNPGFEPVNAPVSGPQIIDLDALERVFVVGAGKGIQRVALAFEDALGDRLTGGVVIDKHGQDLECTRVKVVYGAHPLPDEGCLDGCRQILDIARSLTPRDLVFTLAGNGVSSLLTLPVEGVTLEDLRRVTHMMQIERGVPTGDLNPIRNHLDQMKGGKVTRALRQAQVVHLIAWDCRTYDWLIDTNVWLHFFPDRSTYADAIAMFRKWNAWDDAPASVRNFLTRADPAQETMKRAEFEERSERIYGIMPERIGMLPSAAARARELGYEPYRVSTRLHVESSEYALESAERAMAAVSGQGEYQAPCVLINGGEMVVTVGKENGIGGRNQEYALAAATHIAGSERIVIGSVDSDGTDGPGTQLVEGCEGVPSLAGGIVDGHTMDEARERGVDVAEALRHHDTTRALCALDSGVVATRNISMNDLTVTLIMGTY